MTSYFVGDPDSPTGVAKWDIALRQMKEQLATLDVATPYAAEVLLPARGREELLKAPGDADV